MITLLAYVFTYNIITAKWIDSSIRILISNFICAILKILIIKQFQIKLSYGLQDFEDIRISIYFAILMDASFVFGVVI